MDKRGALLKVLVCSNEHYYYETELIKALNSHPLVKETMVTRYSVEGLRCCNVIFIDPRFRETYGEVQKFIEEIRKKYSYILFVICANQKIINEFLDFGGDRFKHYFQFSCNKNCEIDEKKFSKIIELCKVELQKNYLSDYEYDVALSFAGEDREYVLKVANYLNGKGVKIFYDSFEAVNLFGKDLYSYLSEVYSKKSRYVVMFISKYYAQKRWTNIERIGAQARVFEENREYILPARFDDTEIKGLMKTVGYIDLNNYEAEEFGEIIFGKIYY